MDPESPAIACRREHLLMRKSALSAIFLVANSRQGSIIMCKGEPHATLHAQ